MAKKRILLEEDDFKKLTKGEIITMNGVDIALSDIGYHNMIEIIRMHSISSDIELGCP